jgi:peptide/nickel transport system substrate-binding protein
MVMSKNPNWVDAPKPYLDKLTFRVVPDEDQRIDTLLTGAGDAFYTSTPASVDRGTKGRTTGSYVGVTVGTGQSFVFNTATPPFNDVRVRQAFVIGVDWKALAETIFGKGAVATTNFSVKGTPFYDEKAKLPDYNPAQAQQLLDAVAKDTGGPVKITLQGFQQTLDQARVKFIQTALNQLKNIDVQVTVGDSPTNIGKVLAGQYQTSSWGFPFLDPEPGLWNALHSGLPTNYSKYSNPEVDKALEAARLSTDNAERAKQYNIVFEAAARDLPYYPYVETVNGFVSSAKLHGAQLYEDGILRFDLLWLK